MKKTILALCMVAILSGCSGNSATTTNPDEDFDANYQGSPEIKVEVEQPPQTDTPAQTDTQDGENETE